jgi:hypothetical protein
MNAVSDTGAVNVQMIDQVEWSASASNLNFRAATPYQPTEAKARRIRVTLVDAPASALVDTTIVFSANSAVTLLITGLARNGGGPPVKLVAISDNVTVSPGQIGLRVLNLSSTAIDVYTPQSAADPLPGFATFANVAAVAVTPFIVRSVGNVAVRATAVGTSTVLASADGPIGSTAGVNISGSAFSVAFFPRGVPGSRQNAFATPGVVWYVDRTP